MALTINNGSCSGASYHLGKAQQGFDINTQIASGKKILGPNDDPGTLSVAMKVKASINRLTGAQNNIVTQSVPLRFRTVFWRLQVASS